MNKIGTNLPALIVASSLMRKDAGAFDLAAAAVKATMPFIIGVPPLLGLAAGYGAAKAKEPSEESIDNLQKEILLNEYHTAIAQIRRRREIEELEEFS